MDFKKILRETVTRLLKEAGSSSFSNLINQAIDQGRRAVITYPDQHSGVPVKRDLYVYSYGSGKNGEYIRCFQISNGGSGGHKWKLMRVDRIIDMKLTRFKVAALPSGVPSYRVDGDQQIPNMYNMLSVDKIKNRSFVPNKQELVNKSQPNNKQPEVQQPEPKTNNSNTREKEIDNQADIEQDNQQIPLT